MNPISDKLSTLANWMHFLAGLLTLLLVLLTLEQVVSRYLFDEASIALQELQWHFFAAIFLLAAPLAVSQDQHVRVDVFYSKFTRKTQFYINVFGFVLFLLPSMILLSYFGVEYVELSRSFTGPSNPQGAFYFILKGEGSANPGGLPARWLLKSLIPLCSLTIILQGILFLLKFDRSESK